jgi:hypothetical protein
MSDWIKAESERRQKAKQEAQDVEDFIVRSDYWLKLRQQVGQDVEFLNKESTWKDQLVKFPVEIKDEQGSFEVRNALIPAAYVTVTNKFDHIEIRVKTRKNVDSKYHSHPVERWAIATDQRHVYLQRDAVNLEIPAQASDHILKPIIDALDAAPSELSR